MSEALVPVSIVDRSQSLRDWDPFLRPDWRYERILQMVDRSPTPGRVTRFDDDYIRVARSFILRWRAAAPDARMIMLYENPGLAVAWKIFDKIGTDPEISFMVEARLLADQTYEQIAEAVHTKPAAIEWYEALFFNVKERLRNRDWILKHILMPAADRFSEEEEEDDDSTHRFETPQVVRPHLDFTLKFFSYYGGPILVDFMLSGFKQGSIVRTQDEIGEWLDDVWGHQIRRRSAMAAGVFEINRYNVMELFATHAQIIALSKSIEGQDERRTAYEKAINAMMTEIPWTVGNKAKEVFKDTSVGEYDELSVEPRDEEIMLVAAGENVPELEEIKGLSFPVGSNPDKEVKDANAH